MPRSNLPPLIPFAAAVLCAWLTVAPLPGAAQQVRGPVEDALLEQGRYWQTRNAERATEAWDKLLLARPGQPEALAGLGRIAIAAKKPDQARAYLARLRQAHPGSPEAAQLEQDIETATPAAQAELDAARIALRERKIDQAVTRYRALFKGRPPQGRLGIEFYSMLGYAENSRPEALAGLERLLRDYPGDPQIRVAIANLRLLDTNSRLPALRALLELSKRQQDVGGEAGEQLRDALTWLGRPPPPAYVPIFREYLAANPDDKEIRDQLNAKGRPAGPRGAAPVDTVGLRIAAGYAALEANEWSRAEDTFQAVLKQRPSSGPALGGLGLVRLRQQQFTAARDYLVRASRVDGGARWKTALDSATFWSLVGQAAEARQAGRLAEARALLEQARALDPREPSAQVALGGVLLDQKLPAEAERAFRDVQARAPDDTDALRGLVAAMTADGRGAEALRFIDGLPPERVAQLDLRMLRAEVAASEARSARAAGDLRTAQARFEYALSLAPDEPWVRLDLARLQLQAGASDQARATVSVLLLGSTASPEALYVNALLLAEMRDWRNAYALLDRIPAASRTVPMAALLRRTAVNAEVETALALARDGRLREALASLGQAEARLQDSDAPDLPALVAQAYGELGDLPRASTVLRDAMARVGPLPTLRLQYGELLLRSGDEVGLASLLRDLQTAALQEGDRRRYDGLRRGLTLRQVEALRAQQQLAVAYEWLAPELAASPDDPVVLGALARLYSAAGQPAEALRLYRAVLERSPDDVATLLAVGQLAAAQRDDAVAEEALRAAQRLDPGNPDVLATLGRLARQQGRNAEAVALLKAALAATVPPTAPVPARAVASAMPSFASNPFANFRPGAPQAVPNASGAPVAPLRPGRPGG